MRRVHPSPVSATATAMFALPWWGIVAVVIVQMTPQASAGADPKEIICFLGDDPKEFLWADTNTGAFSQQTFFCAMLENTFQLVH